MSQITQTSHRVHLLRRLCTFAIIERLQTYRNVLMINSVGFQRQKDKHKEGACKGTVSKTALRQTSFNCTYLGPINSNVIKTVLDIDILIAFLKSNQRINVSIKFLNFLVYWFRCRIQKILKYISPTTVAPLLNFITRNNKFIDDICNTEIGLFIQSVFKPTSCILHSRANDRFIFELMPVKPPAIDPNERMGECILQIGIQNEIWHVHGNIVNDQLRVLSRHPSLKSKQTEIYRLVWGKFDDIPTQSLDVLSGEKMSDSDALLYKLPIQSRKQMIHNIVLRDMLCNDTVILANQLKLYIRKLGYYTFLHPPDMYRDERCEVSDVDTHERTAPVKMPSLTQLMNELSFMLANEKIWVIQILFTLKREPIIASILSTISDDKKNLQCVVSHMSYTQLQELSLRAVWVTPLLVVANTPTIVTQKDIDSIVKNPNLHNASDKKWGDGTPEETLADKVERFVGPDKAMRKAREVLRQIERSNDGAPKATQYLETLIQIPFGKIRDEISQVSDTTLKTTSEKQPKEANNSDEATNAKTFIRSKDNRYTPASSRLSTIEESLNSSSIIYKYNTQTGNAQDIEIKLDHDIAPIVKSKSDGAIHYDSDGYEIPDEIHAQKYADDGEDYDEYECAEYLTRGNFDESRNNLPTLPPTPEAVLPPRTRSNSIEARIRKESVSERDALLSELQNKRNQQKEFVENVRTKLDKAVHGHDRAKVQIRRLIAQWMTGGQSGTVIGIQGPPGNGKTTLIRDGLSECLEDPVTKKKRPVGFIPLGGASHGSLLHGHGYTYQGSRWGRIVDILIDGDCMNPILLFDELDKVSSSDAGREIIGVLTHLTDPTQNKEFYDRYFDTIPIDLSKAIIVFTFNNLQAIDPILRDRITLIETQALTMGEKMAVARKHLLPELCENVGISHEELIITDETLKWLIDEYTSEAGARQLRQLLVELIQQLNLMRVCEASSLLEITKDFVVDILRDHSRHRHVTIPSRDMIGQINGMYCNSLGLGGILPIQVVCGRNFTNGLELTGQQGDVMKESMKCARTIALSLASRKAERMSERQSSGKDTVTGASTTSTTTCIASNKQILEDRIDKITEGKLGFHIHCPSTSTPKDGPSAGGAITIAIYSSILQAPISKTVTMTGEIDLVGNITAIGGLGPKLHGAKRAGAKIALFPAENMEDLEKLRNNGESPESDDFQAIAVDNIDTALPYFIKDKID